MALRMDGELKYGLNPRQCVGARRRCMAILTVTESPTSRNTIRDQIQRTVSAEMTRSSDPLFYRQTNWRTKIIGILYGARLNIALTIGLISFQLPAAMCCR